MKPLSSLSYIRSNKKKCLPIFISTILGVFLVYFFGIMLFSSTESFKNSMGISYNSAFVYSIDNLISNDILDKIENDENVKEIIPVADGKINIRLKALFGMMSSNELVLFNEDVNKVLENDNLELVGRLPENNKDEIIIQESIARQIGVEIGDTLVKGEEESVSLDKDYKVVGLIKGNEKIYITCNIGDISREDAKKVSLMYHLKDSNDTSLNDKIKEMLPTGTSIVDYNKVLDELNATVKSSVEFLYIGIVSLMIFIISMSLKNLNKINLINRMDELKILNSIGYSKFFLIIKVFKENGLTILFGTGAGIIISMCIVAITNTVVWMPQGKEALLFLAKPIIASIIAPILICILSTLSSIRVINKINK
ncbi:FtsX-like permease family protein [Clostridium vincentii]|uniref:FtsX-like permease family protein n=1 Tax=Clostridium vincentii TaxID=52704 RepID=A0A2T0BAR8_9CLOT|nr:FtsX-like permease family protein [Clostridium vincentii]PRR80990.1 FtsX-like permease family protein [Clostridium vincentii]